MISMRHSMTATIRKRGARAAALLAVFIVAGAIGIYTLSGSRAATATATIETEGGTASACAVNVSDSTASNLHAIKFSACSSGGTNPSADAGSHLPISYSLSSLAGTIVYVATNGSDSNAGTVSAPYATLSKAISAAPSGGTVVVRGGTYRNQGALSISKTLKVIAYPGETPTFNGATAVSGGWSTTGSLSYRSYTPMPVTDGSGINFTGCQNQTGSCMGKYPDQAWVGSTQLQQVSSPASVTAGTFYVDSTNHLLYMMTTDVNKGSVEVSNERTFVKINAANVTLQGLKIMRYSDTASDYGVINELGAADHTVFDNLFMSDMSFQAINLSPSGSDLNTGTTIQNSTIQYGNWMGVGFNETTGATLNHDIIGNMNQFSEFTSSPASGSLKTSRTWNTTVENSQIKNNKSVGIWFDQSNYKVMVAGNDIEDNTGAGVFFEISDYVYAVNNYIKGSGVNDIEISASSDAYLVNNTLVGGLDPVGVYVDPRSVPGCSDPSQPVCSAVSYSSDRDTVHTHPATLTWIPSINLFLNNIFAYPGGTRYCGAVSNFCITNHNGTVTEALNQVIHHANASLGVPQTFLDGDVYANGTGNIVWTGDLGSFTSLSAWSTALTSSPVSISGMEAHGLAGNSYVSADGSPTAALAALHASAPAVPTDSMINPYDAAGTKHYGVLWK